MATLPHNAGGQSDAAARMTAVLALLAALGFGAVVFQIDLHRAHPAVHMGFFVALCVFLAALTGLLARGVRGDLERSVLEESPREGDVDRPQT